MIISFFFWSFLTKKGTVDIKVNIWPSGKGGQDLTNPHQEELTLFSFPQVNCHIQFSLLSLYVCLDNVRCFLRFLMLKILAKKSQKIP